MLVKLHPITRKCKTTEKLAGASLHELIIALVDLL